MPEKNRLRIAFAGGAGSGKTTCSEYVIEKYNIKYTYINRTRKHIQLYYKNDLNLARQDNTNFQKELLQDKMFWERRHAKTGFVTDRTTIDNTAYFLGFGNCMDKKEVVNYITRGISHAREAYDLIFCLSPILDTPDNPLSPPNPTDKFKIYYMILGMLTLVSSHKPEIVKHINVIDLDTRKALVDNFIEEKLRTY